MNQENVTLTPETMEVEDGHIEDVPVVDTQDEVPHETPVDSQDSAESEAVVEEKPRKKRVSKYSSVTKATFADRLELHGDVYTASLDSPLYILSPTLTLVSDLVDEDGEYAQYANLKLKKTHLKVFSEFEDALLEKAKANKNAWFGNDSISDAFLETSFKRFVDLDAKTLTVKIDEGLGGKTNVCSGTKIKCVLSAPHAIFTRTQFGIPFTLELIKSIEKDETTYLFDPEEDETYGAVTGTDLMTHLIASDEIADEL